MRSESAGRGRDTCGEPQTSRPHLHHTPRPTTASRRRRSAPAGTSRFSRQSAGTRATPVAAREAGTRTRHSRRCPRCSRATLSARGWRAPPGPAILTPPGGHSSNNVTWALSLTQVCTHEPCGAVCTEGIATARNARQRDDRWRRDRWRYTIGTHDSVVPGRTAAALRRLKRRLAWRTTRNLRPKVGSKTGHRQAAQNSHTHQQQHALVACWTGSITEHHHTATYNVAWRHRQRSAAQHAGNDLAPHGHSHCHIVGLRHERVRRCHQCGHDLRPDGLRHRIHIQTPTPFQRGPQTHRRSRTTTRATHTCTRN